LVAENGSSTVSDYAVINHVARGRRVLKLYLASDYMKTLTKATSLKVMGAGLDVPPLRLDGMEALSSVLDGCERTFIKDLGIDVAGVADIAIPASAVKPTDVFDPADYPPEAIKRDLEGDTYILWQIDASGEPQECRILKSSGHDILDQRSCGVIMKRGRFVPARDSGGKSVDSYMSRRVRWRMVR
jgi:TonB family protein